MRYVITAGRHVIGTDIGILLLARRSTRLTPSSPVDRVAAGAGVDPLAIGAT